MEVNLGTRVKKAWNAFLNRDPTSAENFGPSYSRRPDRPKFFKGGERSLTASVLNKMAVDSAAIAIKHVRLDDNDRMKETINSSLNDCLNLSANLDQTGRAFIHDAVLSMLDEGCVALVPVITDGNPIKGTFDVESIRTGKIVQWYPKHVKVNVYDERDGKRKELVFPKKMVAIIENPFYAIMNEPNSILQRLIRKLSLLDVIDEQCSAGKLDLVIQLPYVIKTDARREQAEKRRKDIEQQLAGSKYGIAYTDGTEKITQLNRSLENNIMKEIEFLQNTFYSQMGLTVGVMDGSADEKTLNNYYNRTIEPIMSALVDEMKRKFLSRTAISQRQSICFFRDPFKLVPAGEMAELADKFTRNEILTSNEVRQIVGMKPSDDPSADELRNKNLNQSEEEIAAKKGIDLSDKEYMKTPISKI